MNFDEENFIIGYGARVGYAIMNKEISMNLMKGVEFASSLSALEGTIAALNDLEFIKKQRKLLKMAENICQKSLKN